MRKLLIVPILFAWSCSIAMADSITPTSYSATLAIGESVTISKTVTITEEVVGAKADIFFLFDTTGSMGGVINTAKSTASTLLAGLSGLGDINFGVGSYDDFPTSPYGSAGDIPWTLNSDITGSSAAVQTSIDGLTASGGFDSPESQLTALTATTTDVSWRADATKFVVWFGDAPGHEGTEAGYPGTATTTSTIAALNAEEIFVNAIDYGALDSTGQASAITAATGGAVYDGTFDAEAFIALITDSITTVYEDYSSVCLDPVGSLPGVAVVTSGCIVGDFNRSVERSFDFEVTFTGEEAGTHDFSILAKADDLTVAAERDLIVVEGSVSVPETSSIVLMLIGLMSLGYGRKKLV